MKLSHLVADLKEKNVWTYYSFYTCEVMEGEGEGRFASPQAPED